VPRRALIKSTFASLSNYNYRLYFIGQGISLSGTWLQMIAQGWLIFELTHSGTYVGLLTAAQFFPVLLLGPVGGLIADRFAKQKILYVTQTVSMVLAFVLAGLVLSHTVQAWMVYVLAALLGCVQVVDSPTRQTFILEMVGAERLTNAITLNSIEVNMARVIGPAIAGGLITGIGIGYCFLVNAFTFVAVLFCLFRMRADELHTGERVKKAKGQIRQGLAYAWKTPPVRTILLLMAVIGTLSYEFQVLLPIFAGKTFHSNASGYSLLMSCMGLGAVIGGIITANKKRVSAYGITKAAILFGISLLLTALAPNLLTAGLLMIVVGIFSISFMSLANSTLQLETKSEMRGRVMSLWTVTFLGSTPIGGPIIGFTSEHTSARVGFVIGGLAAVISGLFALTVARHARKLKSYLASDITSSKI